VTRLACATRGRPESNTSVNAVSLDIGLGTPRSAAWIDSRHKFAEAPTPFANVLRNTAARCVPPPSRTSCASHRQRGESDWPLVGVCAVVEWSQNPRWSTRPRAQKRARGHWIISRRERRRRNHLLSWFSVTASIPGQRSPQFSNHLYHHNRSGSRCVAIAYP